MTTVTYKGYQGKVEYEDGVLYIKVLHVDDVLIAECDSAAGVKSAFEDLVDSYIEDCKELGREPTKPFKGVFNVRVGSDTHRSAAMAAANENLTLNAWVASAIAEKLECNRLNDRMRAVVDTNREEMLAIRQIAHQFSLQDHRTTHNRRFDFERMKGSTVGGSPWAGGSH